MTHHQPNRPPCHPCDQRPPRHTTKSCSRKRPISPCQPGPPPRQGAASTGTATIVIHAVNANRANAILDIFFIRVFFPTGLLLLVHVNRLEQDPRHGLCCTSTAKIRVHPKIPRCRTFKTGVAKRKDRQERCLTPMAERWVLGNRFLYLVYPLLPSRDMKVCSRRNLDTRGDRMMSNA